MPTNKPAKKPRYYKNEKWNTVCVHFIASLRTTSTKRCYSHVLLSLATFVQTKHGKQITPDKIKREDIEQFLHRPQIESNYSYNVYLAAIRSLYVYCTKYLVEFRGKQVPLMRKDHLPTIGIAQAKVEDVDRDMEEHEVKAFMDAIDTSTLIGKRDYALFLALLGTGRRRREIALLRRGDFKPEEFKERGKTQWRWMYYYQPKGRTSKEHAEMPPACMDAIRAFHKAAGLDFDTLPEDHPIFFSTRWQPRRQPYSLSNVDIRFRFYARKAGIADNVVVHSLRHEHAWRRYNRNGHDILEVKNALDHKDVQMTLHYIERRKRRRQSDPIAAAIAAEFVR